MRNRKRRAIRALHRVVVSSFLVVTTFFPTAAGQDAGRNEVLVDKPDDVDAGPTAPAHDNSYVDIVNATFVNSATSNLVSFLMGVKSTRGLDPRPSAREISCRTEARAWSNATGNSHTVVGSWVVRWNWTSTTGLDTSDAYFILDRGPSSRNIKHSFSLVVGSPGFYRFDFDRNALLPYFDRLERFFASCYSVPVQAGRPLGFGDTDDAWGQGQFDVPRPIPRTEDPANSEGESSPSGAWPSPETDGGSSGTPAPQSMTLLLLLAGLVAFGRNRSRA